MRFLVVGSGIIGLASAYELLKVPGPRRHDRRRPGAWRGCVREQRGLDRPGPEGRLAPGLVLQTLRWMLRPDSPVYIRPTQTGPPPSLPHRDVPRLQPVGIRGGVRRHRSPRPRDHGRAGPLGRRRPDLRDAPAGRAPRLRRSGRAASGDGGRRPSRARLGFQATPLQGDDARAIVPELADAVVGAIRFPDQRSVQPASLVAALVDRVQALGAGWLEGPVTAGRMLDRLVPSAAGSGVARADAVVIAAGAWSSNVARLFGVRLPIRPGKGYSVDYVPAPIGLRLPIMLSEAHCVITSLDGALRVAGTMELGGLDERVSATRVEALRQAPAHYLRGWDPAAPSATPTAGPAPMAPDGLPIIGRLSGFRNLYVATGHAMLGLML